VARNININKDIDDHTYSISRNAGGGTQPNNSNPSKEGLGKEQYNDDDPFAQNDDDDNTMVGSINNDSYNNENNGYDNSNGGNSIDKKTIRSADNSNSRSEEGVSTPNIVDNSNASTSSDARQSVNATTKFLDEFNNMVPKIDKNIGTNNVVSTIDKNSRSTTKFLGNPKTIATTLRTHEQTQDNNNNNNNATGFDNAEPPKKGVGNKKRTTVDFNDVRGNNPKEIIINAVVPSKQRVVGGTSESILRSNNTKRINAVIPSKEGVLRDTSKMILRSNNNKRINNVNPIEGRSA
jgi:hypothetical protein